MTNPQYVFDRLRNEISAYYMLGVEPLERDRDGRRIRSACRWAARTCRSARGGRCSTPCSRPNTWSRDVVMGRVLRSPAANTELPMRLSTYTFRDAAPNKVKLILAAEIDPESMEKELDLAIGFAMFDEMGKAVLSGQERKIYSANTDLPIRYELARGRRSRHLSAAARRCRYGGEERQRRARGAGVRHGEPRVRAGRSHPQRRCAKDAATIFARLSCLQVADGQLATYTELYTNKPGALDDTKVVVRDRRHGRTARRCRRALPRFGRATDQTMRQALAVVPVGALPPGRYIARAMISRGDKNVGQAHAAV